MSDLNLPEGQAEPENANGTDPNAEPHVRVMPSSVVSQTDAGGAADAQRQEMLVAEAVVVEPLGRPERPAYHASREGLDRAEREVKDEVLRMGSLVAAQIEAALEALVAHDADAATAVIIGDSRINEAQRHVSSLIQLTIATQTPVARDLRLLLALDHVTYELERIGDHAGSVAKQARKLAPEPPLGEYVKLPRMGALASNQVRDVLRSMVELDEASARVVASRDDDMDDLYHSIFAEIVELMREDPANVERGTRILFAAHYIERIGDRVTNIAEDVVFLATGDIEDLNP